MKNTIIIFLFIFSIAASAQVRNYKKPAANTPQAKYQPQKKTTKYNSSNADKDFKFGLIGGVQISNEIGDDIESLSPRTGFYAGISLKTKYSDTVSLEGNLVYSTMGANFTYDFYTVKDELDYLQMQLLYNFKVFNLVNFKIGPQIGSLVSATFDGEDYKDSLNGLDYGAAAGLGLEFPNTNFGINAIYYYGLADIYKDGSGFDNSVTNTSYSIGIHYYF